MTREEANESFREWRLGDSGAGNRLITLYTPLLQRFFTSKVPPAEVDELTQRTWLALLESNKRHGTGATGEADDVKNFRGYLFGIARFMVFRVYRGMHGRDVDPEVDSVEALAPTISRQLSLQRHVEKLDLALQKLPLDLQMLMEARYVDELSGRELAEMFHIPEGTVRSRLSRAHRLLDAALADLGAVATSSTGCARP